VKIKKKEEKNFIRRFYRLRRFKE